MTLLALKALLAKVPGIAWAAVIVVALVIGSAAAIYARGEAHGAQRITRIARHDSVERQIAAIDTAVIRAAQAVETFEATRKQSDSGRAIVHRLSERAAAELATSPLSVRDLVAAQDTAIRRDSITIRAGQSAIDSLIQERFARIALDTLRVHAQEDRPPDGGRSRAADIAIGVGVGIAALATVLHVVR